MDGLQIRPARIVQVIVPTLLTVYVPSARVAGLPRRVDPDDGHVGILAGHGHQDGRGRIDQPDPRRLDGRGDGRLGRLARARPGHGQHARAAAALESHDGHGRITSSAAAAKPQAMPTSRQVRAALARRRIWPTNSGGTGSGRLRASSAAWSIRACSASAGRTRGRPPSGSRRPRPLPPTANRAGTRRGVHICVCSSDGLMRHEEHLSLPSSNHSRIRRRASERLALAASTLMSST